LVYRNRYWTSEVSPHCWFSINGDWSHSIPPFCMSAWNDITVFDWLEIVSWKNMSEISRHGVAEIGESSEACGTRFFAIVSVWHGLRLKRNIVGSLLAPFLGIGMESAGGVYIVGFQCRFPIFCPCSVRFLTCLMAS